MKKTRKIILVLLALLLLSAAMGICALAASQPATASAERTDRVDNTFEIHYPDYNSTNTRTGASNFLDITRDLDSENSSKMIITLLDDFVLTSNIWANHYAGTDVYNSSNPYDPSDKKVDFYLDLNGYDLIFDLSGLKTAIEIPSNINFHLYSSEPGGKVIHSCTNGSSQGLSYSLFNIRYNGASLTVGEVTPPSVRNNSTGQYSKENTLCEGDNLSTYSAQLFTTWSGTSGYQYHLHNGNSITINGGTHYRTAVSRDALLMLEADADLTVKNATFYTSGKGTLLSTNSNLTSQNSVTFENCTISADTLVSHSNARANITLKDCKIAVQKLTSNMAADSKAPAFIGNCLFSAGISPETDSKLVKTDVSELLSLNKISLNYSGTNLNTASPYTEVTDDAILSYNLQTAGEGEYVKITWVDFNGNSVTEEWAKGDDITPIPAIDIPTPTQSCRYVFSPAIAETSGGDATYTLKRTLNFTVITNLTLYTDFVYNIYIPKDIVDADLINTVKLANDPATDPGELEQVILNGKSYYAARRAISAISADEAFSLVINVQDGKGGSFDATYTLSIPSYINAVLQGAYNQESKALVRATYTYIKAAKNYYSDTQTLPYPTETNTDLTALIHRPGAEVSISNDAKEVFDSAALVLEGKIRFRFYIYNTTSAAQRSMVFTYPVNGVEKNIKITAADWTDLGNGTLYYDVTMKAKDLLGNIDISFGTSAKATPDFTYNFANYAYYVNNTQTAIPKLEKLVTLVDALWNYSEASAGYIHGTGTPDVSLTVGGSKVTAATHVIVAEGDALPAAEALRDAINNVTGELLTIVNSTSSEKKNIIISLDTPNVAYDLKATVLNGTLYISCGYKSFITDGTNRFIDANINDQASADISLDNGFTDIYYTDKIYYSDFGAIGNGEATQDIDFAAIYQAHTLANVAKRHTVCADRGARYYIDDAKIDGTPTMVPIKTNVNWGDAYFVIDDSNLSAWNSGDNAIYNKNIFEVLSDHSSFVINDSATLSRINEAGLNPETKVIDLDLNYPALILPYDTTQKIYRRRGYGSWMGTSMHEIILIDKDGNIDPSTPVMFDYQTVSSITVIRVDDDPVTIDGGTFESRASKISTKQGDTVKEPYFKRGININRSNTTMKNVTHLITNEITLDEQKSGMLGNAYSGFYLASSANNVMYENCIMQGRRCYTKPTGGTMGTYDVQGNSVNNLVYKNCVQSNFWLTLTDNGGGSYTLASANENDENTVLSMSRAPSDSTGYQMHWGIGGTNFCKNLAYIGSTLSRIDAHEGMYNGKIIDSTVNFIALTGNGDFIIENSRWFASGSSSTYNSIAYLRDDYGSTWEGTVTIKNVQAFPYVNESGVADANFYLFYHRYTNWYYGYECFFPNVYIENLDLYNMSTNDGNGNYTPLSENHKVYLMASASPDLGQSGTTLIDADMHLATTAGSHPYHPDSSNPYGIQGSDYTNLNPIHPPEFIHIYTNDGVNGAGGYNIIIPTSGTTFFKNTDIISSQQPPKGSVDPGSDDTPRIPWYPDN